MRFLILGILFNIFLLLGTQGLVSSVNMNKLTPTEQLIKKYFPENYETARAVFFAESGLRADVISKTGDVGLSQVNVASHRGILVGDSDKEKIEWLKNPENNIKVARKLYLEQGWRPWYAYLNKSYLKYVR